MFCQPIHACVSSAHQSVPPCSLWIALWGPLAVPLLYWGCDFCAFLCVFIATLVAKKKPYSVLKGPVQNVRIQKVRRMNFSMLKKMVQFNWRCMSVTFRNVECVENVWTRRQHALYDWALFRPYMIGKPLESESSRGYFLYGPCCLWLAFVGVVGPGSAGNCSVTNVLLNGLCENILNWYDNECYILLVARRMEKYVVWCITVHYRFLLVSLSEWWLGFSGPLEFGPPG